MRLVPLPRAAVWRSFQLLCLCPWSRHESLACCRLHHQILPNHRGFWSCHLCLHCYFQKATVLVHLGQPQRTRSLPHSRRTHSPRRQGPRGSHLCAGLLCVSICDVTSWMFMGRPGGSSPSAGGDTGCSSQGHATEPPRRLTVQGDPVVLLHRLQRVRLPFEVHVRRPQAAARPVVVHGRLLQGPKLCKELLRTRRRGAHASFRAADAQQLSDTTALGSRRSLSKPRR